MQTPCARYRFEVDWSAEGRDEVIWIEAELEVAVPTIAGSGPRTVGSFLDSGDYLSKETVYVPGACRCCHESHRFQMIELSKDLRRNGSHRAERTTSSPKVLLLPPTPLTPERPRVPHRRARLNELNDGSP